MKRATTQQFRNAVRKIAAKKGAIIGNSWTNGAPKRYYNADYGSRTVCMEAQFDMSSCGVVGFVAKVEKKLNKKGVTADTRFTFRDGRGGYYIRGTVITTMPT